MENKRRASLVGFRVSDAERRMVEALARQLERNMSDAVRYVVRQAALEMLAQTPAQFELSGGEVCEQL